MLDLFLGLAEQPGEMVERAGRLLAALLQLERLVGPETEDSLHTVPVVRRATGVGSVYQSFVQSGFPLAAAGCEQ